MDKPSTYKDLTARVRELEEMLEDEGRAVQWEVLRHLAQTWDRDGPPGIVENRDLAEALHLGTGTVSLALKSLARLGITDRDTLGFASYLTPEGYDIAKCGYRKIPLTMQIATLHKSRIKGKYGQRRVQTREYRKKIKV